MSTPTRKKGAGPCPKMKLRASPCCSTELQGKTKEHKDKKERHMVVPIRRNGYREVEEEEIVQVEGKTRSGKRKDQRKEL